jgi:hypothetical protein
MLGVSPQHVYDLSTINTYGTITGTTTIIPLDRPPN